MIVFLCYKVVRSNAAVAHAHFEIGEITFDYLSVVIPRTGLVCLDAEPEFVDKSIVFIHRQVLWYCDLHFRPYPACANTAALRVHLHVYRSDVGMCILTGFTIIAEREIIHLLWLILPSAVCGAKCRRKYGL